MMTISSLLSSYHEKATVALYIERIQTRLEVVFFPNFWQSFASDFFNLLLLRFHQAKIIYLVLTHLLPRHFVRRRCTDVGDGTEEPMEVLCDEVETAKGFCYLGDRLNASGGSETAVTSKVRIGWMKFRECGKLLRGRRFSLRMKGMIYRSIIVLA